jgi:GT2 family glycosyltransferase
LADVTIVVINFNTKEMTLRAIERARASVQNLELEVLVVDNSTRPEERLGQGLLYRLIEAENHGFGHACNLGARQALAPVLLFLNSDGFLEDGAIEAMYQTLREDGRIGAVGSRVYLEDGTLDHGCKRGFPTPWNAFCYFSGLSRRMKRNPEKYDGYALRYLDEHSRHEVDAISGSCMMIPKHVFMQVGGFDERYFMYAEDLDLCYAIMQAGYKIVYQPKAQMLHLKGQSGLHTYNRKVSDAFYDSMKLFYEKNFQDQYGKFTRWLVYAGIGFKKMLAHRTHKGH